MSLLFRVAVTSVCFAAVLMAPPAAQAELPPYVYADQQRQAEVVVRLKVLQTRSSQNELTVLARVLRVNRQPASATLRQGQDLRLRYPLPIWHRQGWVGPSPVPVLKSGEQVTAWLNRESPTSAWFRPAAGGHSFGPALEAMPTDPP